MTRRRLTIAVIAAGLALAASTTCDPHPLDPGTPDGLEQRPSRSEQTEPSVKKTPHPVTLSTLEVLA